MTVDSDRHLFGVFSRAAWLTWLARGRLYGELANRSMAARCLRRQEGRADVSPRNEKQLPARRLRTSRDRYQAFVQDYKHQRLDQVLEAEKEKGRRRPMPPARTPRNRPNASASAAASGASTCASTCAGSGRTATRSARVFVLALLAAGLEMIEPLFMRFIIDRVLLNTELDAAVAPDPPPPGRRRCSSA